MHILKIVKPPNTTKILNISMSTKALLMDWWSCATNLNPLTPIKTLLFSESQLGYLRCYYFVFDIYL